jgi:hypothetical protein
MHQYTTKSIKESIKLKEHLQPPFFGNNNSPAAIVYHF